MPENKSKHTYACYVRKDVWGFTVLSGTEWDMRLSAVKTNGEVIYPPRHVTKRVADNCRSHYDFKMKYFKWDGKHPRELNGVFGA